jgi:hypothetical protein
VTPSHLSLINDPMVKRTHSIDAASGALTERS